MSERDLAKVIGRAVLDPDFAGALSDDPTVVAKSIGAQLSDDESQSLKELSPEHIASVRDLLRQQLPSAAFFDQQQQQQQQARMD